MTIEWDEEAQSYKLDGLLPEELDNPFGNMTDEDYASSGMFNDEEYKKYVDPELEAREELIKKRKNNWAAKLDDWFGYTSPDFEKDYEKLSVGETFKDIGQAVGTEALHFFQPKSMETQYEARTQAAENLKYLYRYGIGFVGFGKVNAAVKGVIGATKAAKAISAALKGTKLAQNISKSQKAQAALNVAKKAGEGLWAGAEADFTLSRPEENDGYFADLLPEDNPIRQWFETKEAESGLEYKAKHLLDGMIAGITGNLALEYVGKPLWNSLKKMKAAKGAKNVKEVVEAESAKAERLIDNSLLVQDVQEAVAKAQAAGIEDIEKYLSDTGLMTNANKNKILDIYNIVKNGDEVICNEDGSFSVKVSKWQDTAKVSEEELARQTGNDGINLMDNTVKDVWKERGLLTDNEELITITKTRTGEKRTVNTKASDRILNNYKDKFNINNNIKLEWTDGKIQGAEGKTTALTNKGKKDIASLKKTKAEKRALIEESQKKIKDYKSNKGLIKTEQKKKVTNAKKKLQIQTLQDRIKHLEDSSKIKQSKENLKNLKDKETKLQYVTHSYKGGFYKQLLSSPDEQGVTKAVKGLNKIVDDLNKNIKLLDDLESLEKRAEEIINKAPEKAQEGLYDDFYKIIKEASSISDVKSSQKQDLLKRLKEQLKIAQEEYKNFNDNRYAQTYDKGIKAEEAKLKKLKEEYAALEADIMPEIHIQIDKNTQNPYAVLRSELEHARDIAKREVPNQNEKHFARYKGKNESEMSLGYVKKKADTRASKGITEKHLKELNKKYDFEDVNSTPETHINHNELNKNTITVKSKDNKDLGHIIYYDTGNRIFISDMQNYKIERGTGRAAVAYLMQKFPDKTIDWVSISEGSTKSYKEFCKEYPELAKRVKFTDDVRHEQINKALKKPSEEEKQAILDEVFNDSYNSEKGVIADETEVHNNRQSEESERTIQDVDSDLNKSVDTGIGGESTVSNNGRDTRAEQRSSTGTGEVESDTARVSSNSNQSRPKDNQSGIKRAAEQSPTDRVVNSNGNIEEISKALDDTNLNLDPQTFENLANNADAYYNMLAEAGVTDVTGLKEAFAQGDINYVKFVVSKQLAAQRIISDLMEEVKQGADDIRVNDIFESINYLQSYIEDLASSYGGGLGGQRFVHQVKNFFGITTLQEQQLNSIADILSFEFKSLDFTRGAKELKEQAYRILSKVENGKFLSALADNSEVMAEFEKTLDKLLKNNITDKETITKYLRSFATTERRRALLDSINKAPKDSNWSKFIKGLEVRGIKKGGLDSYVVHNLLSGTGTPVVNLLSGIHNSIYFPLKKYIAGLISGNDELADEAWGTFIGMAKMCSESFKIAREAFRTGDGQMISFGKRRTPIDSDNDLTTAFNSWDNFIGQSEDGNYWNWLQNLHSFGTRFLGASDEFLTQLNYRSISYGKALRKAETLAQKEGRGADLDYIKSLTDKHFNTQFDEAGQPLDLKAFAEAREIVYQTPTSGKYLNPITNRMEQVKEQTLTMRAAECLSAAANKHPSIRFFVPFVRTPANIMQMNLEHNPLYCMLSPSQRRLIMSNTPEGAIAKVQMGVGALNFTLGSLLATSGLITGSNPKDENTRKALYKTGWRPYSFKVGDKYFSYQRLEPLATILATAADWRMIYNDLGNMDLEEEEKFGRFADVCMSNLINTTLDKSSFLTGLEQMQNMYDLISSPWEEKGEKLAQLARPFLPAVGLTQSVNPTPWGEYEGTQPDGWYQTAFNKWIVPIQADYRRNVFGERQDMFNAIISTGVENSGDNPEDIAMKYLATQGWSPADLVKSERGTSINYKDFKTKGKFEGRSVYDLMLETMSEIEIDGKTLREAVRETVESDEYQYLNDGISPEWSNETNTKKNWIASIYREYKKAALNEVIDNYGDDFVNSKGQTMSEVREEERLKKEEEYLNSSIDDTLENIRRFN